MKTKIDLLVTEYLTRHPNFAYPESGDRHPSILAIGEQMQPWLIDVLGGPSGYWVAMLDCAKEWFSSERATPSREFRLFCHFFEAMGNVSGNGSPEHEKLNRVYMEWRGSGNPKFAPGWSAMNG